MIKVEQAEQFILNRVRDYGTEYISFRNCTGRILAEAIRADRDFPPFDRVAMDGIAISYSDFESGIRSFPIQDVQSAGKPQLSRIEAGVCLEVMTGAVCPSGCDTVIRYEDLLISEGIATVQIADIRQGQNVHAQGSDREKGAVLIEAGIRITAAEVGVIATVGRAEVKVKKFPRVAIVSNGDELVAVDEQPQDHQIRRSNVHMLEALLGGQHIPVQLFHWPDEPGEISSGINKVLEEFDVILLSGGVSMGKFDHLPSAFRAAGINQIFHRVEQRPGKPFWFGEHPGGTLLFAFPGNPVSTFMCAVRYFIPWLEQSLGIKATTPMEARLQSDFFFRPNLTYFLQCKLVRDRSDNGAIPVPGHGSGDLANLLEGDGFLELPADRRNFYRGELFRFWAFRPEKS
ncbi:MAG: molybdopterin molybdotransferase MoeA [Flavobacteriales bacterium]|nr:molybdopterin molybdotransferase MoeA [Flavobacteriales bacterium]